MTPMPVRTVNWLAIDTRECACGGVISVVGHPMTDHRITLAVQGHQLGDRHQSWIRMGGIEAMGDDLGIVVPAAAPIRRAG